MGVCWTRLYTVCKGGFWQVQTGSPLKPITPPNNNALHPQNPDTNPPKTPSPSSQGTHQTTHPNSNQNPASNSQPRLGHQPPPLNHHHHDHQISPPNQQPPTQNPLPPLLGKPPPNRNIVRLPNRRHHHPLPPPTLRHRPCVSKRRRLRRGPLHRRFRKPHGLYLRHRGRGVCGVRYYGESTCPGGAFG